MKFIKNLFISEMKIKINELRNIIKNILREELSTDTHLTIPAELSKDENEFNKDVSGRWGKDKKIPKTDFERKSSRVYNLVNNSGIMSKLSQEKRMELANKFDEFYKSKNEHEKLIMTTEELANEFLNSISNWVSK